MIYLSLLILLPALWFGWWWLLPLIAFLSGLSLREQKPWHFAAGAGLAWSALAFIRDGELAGIVSERMSGAFFMPWGPLFFVIVFLVAFITAWLWFRVGRALRS